MKRVEQKERLKEIIASASEVLDTLKDHESEYNSIASRFTELAGALEDFGNPDILENDLATYHNRLVISIINDQTEIENTVGLLEDFQTDLEGYMDELSDSRREKLEERYESLSDIIEEFELENNEVDDFDDTVSTLEDLIQRLKELL